MPGEDTILEEMGREHRLGRCVGLITTLLCLWHHGAVLGSSPHTHCDGAMQQPPRLLWPRGEAVLLHCTECKHPILQRSELPRAWTHRAPPALPQAPNPLGQPWRSQYRALHSQAMV